MNVQAAAFTVRPVRAGDESAIRDLRLEGLRLHPTAFGGDLAEEAGRPAKSWSEWVAGYLDSEMNAAFVAEASGELAGMIVLRRGSSVKMRHGATIYGMYVRSPWRGQGVASRLLESGAVWAAERGVRLLKLAVEAANGAAIRCYLRNGYTVYGVDPQVIYHDGVYYDTLLMVRHL